MTTRNQQKRQPENHDTAHTTPSLLFGSFDTLRLTLLRNPYRLRASTALSAGCAQS
jgi:hypothetical protein